MGKKLINWAVYLFVAAFRSSCRYRYFFNENRLKCEDLGPKNGQHIVPLWHEQLIPLIWGHALHRYVTMASISKDGEIIAFTLKKIGLRAVRGSSSKGGLKAKNDLEKILLEGYSGALTVDGPRGPRRIPHRGIIELAHKTKIPLLPKVGLSHPNYTFERSWDKMQLPLPFCKIFIAYGEPFMVTSVGENLTEEEIAFYKQKIIQANEDLEAKLKVELAKNEKGSKKFPLLQIEQLLSKHA